MTTDTNPQANVKKAPVISVAQVLVVLAALAVAIVLVTQGNTSGEPDFDMLAYLDSRIATQEDVKDVRCWSSFCKLQMFLTGVEIAPDAVGVRIESHMKLIQSIWEESGKNSRGSLIPAPAVSEVLQRRFPSATSDEGTTFDFGEDKKLITVGPDALKDYSDTIEPWRLLQTWASRHTGDSGKLELKRQFDEEALGVMYEFLRAYDLAILQRAREIARDRKIANIDAKAMSAAFES